MLVTSDFVASRYEALRARAPNLDVVTALTPDVAARVEVLFTFKLPSGLAARLPNLKLVASVGAGVDGILDARDLPAHVRVTRAADAGLGYSMAQFVAMLILRDFRSLSTLERHHRDGVWERLPVPDASRKTVGVMGIGAIGSVVCSALTSMGFHVIGWARSPSHDAQVRRFVGKAGLYDFLGRCDYLVVLLPKTIETAGLLDRSTLGRLPQGSYVINVARGGIVVEDDLLGLVDAGHLRGAALDVFDEEPLPATSALWRHERILVTPHVAAQPTVAPVVEQFLENLSRLSNGQPLLNEVDRALGY